jgi:hypothetical protein
MAFTESDLEEFIRFLTALAASFGREADEPTCMAYEIGLSDLPLAACKAAMMRGMRECKFMPSPAELRELAGVQKPQQRAVLAWEALDGAVCDHGYYRSVDFDDPVINATVRNLGGWERICSLEGDEYTKWFRKEFERVYLALMAVGVGPDQAAPLLGHFAKQNSGNGQPIAPPVKVKTGLPALPLIGNESQTLTIGVSR